MTLQPVVISEPQALSKTIATACPKLAAFPPPPLVALMVEISPFALGAAKPRTLFSASGPTITDSTVLLAVLPLAVRTKKIRSHLELISAPALR